MRVKTRTGLSYDGVHQLEQPHGVLHGGGHELPQVGGGQLLHDLEGDRLAHHQQEGDGHVMVALVVLLLLYFKFTVI